jgi:hypothetical protein
MAAELPRVPSHVTDLDAEPLRSVTMSCAAMTASAAAAYNSIVDAIHETFARPPRFRSGGRLMTPFQYERASDVNAAHARARARKQHLGGGTS